VPPVTIAVRIVPPPAVAIVGAAYRRKPWAVLTHVNGKPSMLRSAQGSSSRRFSGKELGNYGFKLAAASDS
jgi:hypothetical protein